MNIQDPLFALLHSLSSIDAADYAAFKGISKERILTKGEFWIRQGDFASEVAFVQKGYLRKYYIEEGQDITDFFYLESSFMGDLPSIFSAAPTLSYVEAMEPCLLRVWNYQHIDTLCKTSHTLERLMRKITELSFVTFYNRTKSFTTQSPKERYHTLMQQQPSVLQRATQYHIASYLGIGPQHLSSIRSTK